METYREWDWGLEKIPALYLPYTQNPSRLMSIVIRANGDPGQLTSAVRQIVEGLDANQPVTKVHTMDELLAQAVSQRRLSMLVLAVFAGVAMLLAAVGIYGVMAYTVAQRTHEIGIRMALGAEPADVLHMIVGDGMRLAGIRLGCGIDHLGDSDALSAEPALRRSIHGPVHIHMRGGRPLRELRRWRRIFRRGARQRWILWSRCVRVRI